MNFDVLNRIKKMQNNQPISILYLAYQNSQQILKAFGQYQNFQFDVICTSAFSFSSLRFHHIPPKNVTLYLSDNQELAYKKYDLIIVMSLMQPGLGTLFNQYNFKYVLTLNEEKYIPRGYQKLSQFLFKKIQKKEEKIEKKQQPIEKQLTEEQKQKIAQSNELFKEFTQEYQLKPVKYGKYGINYLYDVVPGKISIIMIVSERNNGFADLIRQLKAQNMESVEYIIVDNAAGFRNNVKPDIRYGNKMPVDFCQYHAKQLTSGEYIIVLNETSKSFQISDYISKGKYQTR